MNHVASIKRVKITKGGKGSYWTYSQVTQFAISSKQFFAIDSALLYASLPQRNTLAGLSDNAARLYLLILYRSSLKKNHVWVGPKDAAKYIGLKRKEYVNAVNELDQKGFTKPAPCKQTNHGGYCRDILSVPYYDMSTGVYQLNQQVRSTSNNVSATSFVMIPGMLIEDKWLHKKMNLSLRAIKVLLKLYEYNNLVEFGGVNPAKLTKDSAYTVQICPMLYHDIGLSEAEFRSSFDRLINVGLVREVDAIMSVYLLNLGVEYRFQCEDYWFTKSGYSLQANSKALKIYRPTYQYSDDISGWLDSMVQRGFDVDAISKYIDN
ncbi:hypothetical protein [Paenibacillus sp. FSL H8-0034]|uniref:hypothetical protein n=1 Tax=Paenibacillus sp. FSL H8-0034 TaxID=2954671 RepID=UPI0030FC1B80